MNKLRKIYKEIKNVKIQGATNIAKAGVEAYFLSPTSKNRKKIVGLRPTEPMLSNAVNLANEWPKEEILRHFSDAQKKINVEVFKIIKNGNKILTHCHSTNVINALIYSKKKGKKFEVYNTETRPLYQGRITAEELSKNGIKVTNFVDSAMHEAIYKSDLILIGADAILKKVAINKIGSGLITELAFFHKKPIYIAADSWKFSPRNVKIEERDFHEVWMYAPKKIKIRNPAFEKVEKKKITKIITELGNMKYEEFLIKIEKEN